ncbi:ABC transporter ATP-binding protein [Dyella silvatica]|uniref:ABC transporter ATP-binding protein n=1 Tax=Dyella silvatica TaxID=2992128 RepID=UPI002250B563|nr:ABC transporter ATP-binding protein [Dyella silvatica]
MPSIQLRSATVDFPIYNARTRSLRHDLLRRVGGRIQPKGDLVTVNALRNVTLSLFAGDRLAILGGNGAGKSTLLRVFAGSYEPSDGTADISGSVSSLLDITLGMDFELTGEENIFLRGAFAGMSPAEIKQRIPEIAEFSELGDYLHLPVRTYSSGMMLRLAFAISTARAPDILLLDEMIGVGDRAFSAKTSKRLENLMDTASILALASHDPTTLSKYCNRAVLLRGGEIVMEGTLTTVLKAYEAAPPSHHAEPA